MAIFKHVLYIISIILKHFHIELILLYFLDKWNEELNAYCVLKIQMLCHIFTAL
jgi:hypothetical protein